MSSGGLSVGILIHEFRIFYPMAAVLLSSPIKLIDVSGQPPGLSKKGVIPHPDASGRDLHPLI